MSVSIGIGIKELTEGSLSSVLAECANSFSYGLELGVDSFENDVREGVQLISEQQGWNQVYCLRFPKDGSANLAFGVHEELSQLEMGKGPPVFFDFIRAVSREVREANPVKFGLFFASEWYEKDRIRMNYGNVERLLSILSLPGHWCVRVLNPITGNMEDWDELPFLYDFAL